MEPVEESPPENQTEDADEEGEDVFKYLVYE